MLNHKTSSINKMRQSLKTDTVSLWMITQLVRLFSSTCWTPHIVVDSLLPQQSTLHLFQLPFATLDTVILSHVYYVHTISQCRVSARFFTVGWRSPRSLLCSLLDLLPLDSLGKNFKSKRGKNLCKENICVSLVGCLYAEFQQFWLVFFL